MPAIGDMVTIAIAGEVMSVHKQYANVRIGNSVYRFSIDSLKLVAEDEEEPPVLEISVHDGVGTADVVGG